MKFETDHIFTDQILQVTRVDFCDSALNSPLDTEYTYTGMPPLWLHAHDGLIDIYDREVPNLPFFKAGTIRATRVLYSEDVSLTAAIDTYHLTRLKRYGLYMNDINELKSTMLRMGYLPLFTECLRGSSSPNIYTGDLTYSKLKGLYVSVSRRSYFGIDGMMMSVLAQGCWIPQCMLYSHEGYLQCVLNGAVPDEIHLGDQTLKPMGTTAYRTVLTPSERHLFNI